MTNMKGLIAELTATAVSRKSAEPWGDLNHYLSVVAKVSRADGDLMAKSADALTVLQAENERLRWEAKCLGETLDAWFNRRKLGHDAVDQAVVDAASGYLRTSRVGGMSNEESDMILDVIQDMARLGLFADLFTRAALKGDAP